MEEVKSSKKSKIQLNIGQTFKTLHTYLRGQRARMVTKLSKIQRWERWKEHKIKSLQLFSFHDSSRPHFVQNRVLTSKPHRNISLKPQLVPLNFSSAKLLSRLRLKEKKQNCCSCNSCTVTCWDDICKKYLFTTSPSGTSTEPCWYCDVFFPKQHFVYITCTATSSLSDTAAAELSWCLSSLGTAGLL